MVRQILRKSENEQTQVFYIPGNHDEFLREYIAEHQFLMGNIAVLDEATHVTKTGDRLWIIHGDAFDGVTRHHRWVALLGDAGYTFLLWSNGWFNQLRRLLHLPYWSLSAAIKHKVKQAVNFVYDFEHTVAREAGKRGYDGVVCGHIHQAQKSSSTASTTTTAVTGLRVAPHSPKTNMARSTFCTGRNNRRWPTT